MKILNLPQGSPEWLAVRKQYTTASDMASILEIKTAFSTRKKIMLEKLSTETKELSPYVEAMFQRGHEVEEELRNWVEWRTKLKFPGCVVLDKRRGILASIDGVNFDKGVIIECKNTTAASKIELAKRKQVWEPYRIQVLTQMLVTKIDVAFLITKDDTTGKRYIARIRPDKKMMRKIAKEAKLFVKELNEAI